MLTVYIIGGAAIAILFLTRRRDARGESVDDWREKMKAPKVGPRQRVGKGRRDR